MSVDAGETAAAGSGRVSDEILLSVSNLKKYFPVTAGFLVQRTVVDGHYVPATQREDAVDSGLLERTRRKLPSMYRHDVLQ